ncbi:transketolase [Acidisphaera rubrifaciens]|uniref:Transketolase n=1 Tax=Acidisphaera rubrifaciens HS-AP3 TaxID=1231350 RepID=A0A0D6P5E0_9PROT|nr:transketolase [Acidisphaera rubrifaciens]GAN76408.1 transketolase [Acidisphaera rubrifaciens HS-AP3]
MTDDKDLLCINTIRTLAMDAVQKANSGHPGTPMGLAPVAYTLWQDFLRFDPAEPTWPNRDRFVLSVGHASMLLYSLLHLTRTRQVKSNFRDAGPAAITLDDIKNFRQLNSPCAGHPEFHMASGIECTTGPLGQGVGMSVGMAIAERWLATRYNKPGATLIDYDVYALCGDGDMMEGISSEAASLAGHLRLSNLCWIYDSNRISIEGSTDLAFSEDVGARFLAYGWNVLRVRDANDTAAVKLALQSFKREQSRPTFILVESHIGYGAPHKQDTKEAHGEPLGADEIKGAKRAYGWPEDAQFLVPDGVYEHFAAGIGARGAASSSAWKQTYARYAETNADLAREFDTMLAQGLPAGWEEALAPVPADAKGAATRDSSGKTLNALAERIPYLLGGAADLAPSTKTALKGKGDGSFEATNYAGRNFHFGVREHAMGAIVNGMSLSGLRAFGSGFLIFSDYMRAAIRLSAIQETPSVWVFTHDSIGVGEDGPTHQPIEQLASLRAIPGLHTIRPCDANEVEEAWRVALSSKYHPTCLILSRQPLPTLDRAKFAPAAGLARGAYVLADPADGRAPEVILMATGSEVPLCVEAWETLSAEGVAARIVSMPCWDLFEQQDEAYRRSVLPDAVTARVAVEQAATLGWDRYAGLHGTIIGMHTFGASAPMKSLLTKFGFTGEKVLEAARAQLARQKTMHRAAE